MSWTWIWVVLAIFLLALLLSNNGNKPVETLPPPPLYELDATISGNTFEYLMTYKSGNKPIGLYIEVTHHRDLFIDGRNLEDGKIILDPEQQRQGDPYTIRGGSSSVGNYKITLTPFFQYNETYSAQLGISKNLTYYP